MTLKRPSVDEYFMEMAHLVKKRSTCLRRQVGAVLVRDKRVISTGYNGAPRGQAHCDETGCQREEKGIKSGVAHELCRGVHAEQNAIIQAAEFGVSTAGSVLYCTAHPCVLCAKMIINAGISEIVYDSDYVDDLAKRMLGDSDMPVRQFTNNK